MRTSLTAVLERNLTVTSSFETEPYEAGWASEARWFIHVFDVNGASAPLAVTTQVSPDGLVWCDHMETKLECAEPALLSWPVREFGQWLRLRATLDGVADTTLKAHVYLALKS
jgi:hypothetical protein